jgi:N-acetylmuramoyl-L-alanine amidase
MKPEYIVIHHSLTKDGTTKDWDAIRRYHIETNGWSDIGYHHGIERINGVLTPQVGRPEFMAGAHAKEVGMNEKSLGVCVVGNFDLAAPDIEMLRMLKSLCLAIMVNYSIPAQKVIAHRDVGLMAGFDWQKGQFKACPGTRFPMAALRDALMGKVNLG